MTSKRIRRNPTLPQHDSPTVRKVRAAALAAKRRKYGWTTDVSSLPGVPLSTSVPYFDQPSLPWLYTLASTLIPIVENTVADVLTSTSSGSLRSDADEVTDDLPDIARGRAEISGGYAEIEKGLVEVADGVTTPQEATAGSGVSDVAKTALDEAIFAVRYLMRREQPDPFERLEMTNDLVKDHATIPQGTLTLEDYRRLFVVLPLPDIAEYFAEDASFARMRVAGPNPMLLRAATTVPAGFEQVPAAAAAATDARLFVVDYAELDALVAGTSEGRRQFLWRPIALFDVDDDGVLRPLAIKLGQDAGDTVVTPPADGTEGWAWEMAKFAVQVADGNYHELFVHLARTHLVQEACVVASYRNFAPRHPLSVLLIPHFQGTLFINNSAAGSLIAEGGPIDRIFAGTISSVQEAAAQDRLAFDFTSSMLPSDLDARGVGIESALIDFPYRDDAILVWDAIHAWVTDYVNVYYRDDDDVAGDTELAAWAAEIATTGRLRGLVAPTSRAELTDVMTMVIFTGSAQHAAVNFTQRSLMTFAPNVTGAGWAPGSVGAPDEATWLEMMPPADLASEQLRVLALLGGVHFSKLGEYRKPYWRYGQWLVDPAIAKEGGPLARFQSRLSQVEAEIDRRNSTRTVPYEYLKPSRIPQSINI